MHDRSLSRTRNELSAFLIRHRKQLTPADVGLPATERRRTPGLRREEVAALAGVGLTWYTWFEQGRDIQVSEKFLLSVAYALQLDDAECSHLFLLAHRRPPPPEAHQSMSVTPGIRQLLDDLPRPAYVQNLRWDVVAWNAAADALFGFSARARADCNLLRLAFADPDMRARLPGWHDDAPRLLAQLRYDIAVAPDDPAMRALIEDLQVLSPSFGQAWAMPDSTIAARGIRSIVDSAGSLHRFHHETLVVNEHRHLKMVVYFAA
ncbi:helix-turn-helix transcriptional regulator [Chitiniphilus purpureus]|uniref:Helix-turn-helix transcriptional regulator n=1 Tax=Chitiniphilus purpureus TaxID=2981137 RepID=A0ABY6DM68_9NEIS|nr:helix-turn-helix transcriptional regulator [Chitiniphilus sp. CD1]UXY15449.1 helix-turn-helix transcriptional regulator [Chitiniphilus sp. CD1]